MDGQWISREWNGMEGMEVLIGKIKYRQPITTNIYT